MPKKNAWKSMPLEDRIELALRVYADMRIRPHDCLPQAVRHAEVGEAKYRELRVKGFSEAAKAARAEVIKSVILEY